VNVETTTSSLTYATLGLAHAEVSIRALQQRDLRPLEWHGGPDLREFYTALGRAHEAQEIHVLVAEFNAFPIGLANIHWPGKPTHPNVPDVQSLRVHPIFRGLQIGSRLLETCELLVSARGFERIGLSVGLSNSKARKLYERHSYRVDGTPYCDVWYYTDVRGQSVRVEEHVLDMVKGLSRLP
jgi:ribosomal protein S18 acetylase RimI-like enzyme